MILEICTDTLASSITAEKAGADRIELCADLCVGGTTPSAGLIKNVMEKLTIPVAVMIRPRSGDFCYNAEELETMKYDIDFAKSCGAEGVVLGVLTPEGEIDEEVMAMLIERARPMAVVCHRAFDMTKEPKRSLEILIKLGVNRLLTSGFANKSIEGVDTLKTLSELAAGRIDIIAGSGVNIDNIPTLMSNTSILQYHLSGKRPLDSKMIFRKDNISMGSASGDNEYQLEEAHFETITAVADLLKKPKNQ
ncbi:MAG: copper homeostasis protein CutC [Clostridia bacterium]|nr:copper homeostasis protein CutC [Clostridia bacterium]